MAHIEKRGESRWRARYRDPDGRERSRTFSRKADAQRWLDTVCGELVRSTYIDPRAGRRLFRDYAEAWQGAQVHRATTAAQVESNLKNHVLPFLGDRPLAAIRPSEVQGWVKARSAVLAPATVEVVYRYVVAIFRAAVADRLIPTSPCVGIKLPRVEREPVVPLATEQVTALVAAVPQRCRGLVVLTAGTGLRQGEAFGLTVPHVDFLRRTLRVTQQVILLANRPPYLAPPKTAASRRTVPLPTVVVDALAEHLAAFPADPRLVDRLNERGEPEEATEQLLFTTDTGLPIRRTRFSEKVWIPAVKAAGLPEGTGFHALRHYYASLLIRHGESVKVVQARLGHASATETLDTYGHLWPDSDDRTRQAVDAELRAAASSRPEAAL